MPTDDRIDLNQRTSRLGFEMITNQSITFFDTQFQKQVANNDFALNPFEKTALPFVRGRALDLGCGMGNLSIEAARRGENVVAVDASSAAIERIQKTAAAENLAIDAVLGTARRARAAPARRQRRDAVQPRPHAPGPRRRTRQA